jgi:hypothetical protein
MQKAYVATATAARSAYTLVPQSNLTSLGWIYRICATAVRSHFILLGLLRFAEGSLCDHVTLGLSAFGDIITGGALRYNFYACSPCRKQSFLEDVLSRTQIRIFANARLCDAACVCKFLVEVRVVLPLQSQYLPFHSRVVFPLLFCTHFGMRTSEVPNVDVLVTCLTARRGYASALEGFGMRILLD